MSNGDEIDVGQQPLDILKKKIQTGFRFRINRPLPAELAQQLHLEEAWNDMARAAQGKRVLQRLNGGQPGVPPSYDAFRRSLQHFGGLEPPGPPKILKQQLIKGPSISDLFQSDYMQRIRRSGLPSLTDYKPKPVEPMSHTWNVPTGRTAPYPGEVTRIPPEARQDWLRTYYRANPMAAQQARSEARTVIDWAHRYLR